MRRNDETRVGCLATQIPVTVGKALLTPASTVTLHLTDTRRGECVRYVYGHVAYQVQPGT